MIGRPKVAVLSTPLLSLVRGLTVRSILSRTIGFEKEMKHYELLLTT